MNVGSSADSQFMIQHELEAVFAMQVGSLAWYWTSSEYFDKQRRK